ncbi:hypothetical protein KY290_032563 [Solanum tuberosum]|uniref:Uncharacterized protein n=1 Tax=Solanum tuberosum TaxID=4113 RepID=A0ABQ7UCH4_SOLTU|nr:hypothetical protein KY290_032563 [Solanum tuberosum]
MSLDPSKLPDPPMPSYAFTIYHRDVFEKSKFKNYDSLLKNRLARCEDRANYIASILEDNNNVKEGANFKILEKAPKSTSVYFAHGTFISRFPQDLYTVFRYIFRSEIKDIPLVESPYKSLDTCVKADPSGRELYFPVVKLYFGDVNPKNMLLLAKERVMIHFDGYYCLAFMGWNRSHSIIGTNQLQGATITNFPPDFSYVFRDTFREEVKDIPLYDAPLGSFDTCYMVDPGVVPTFPS